MYGVSGEINLAHRAFTDELDDLVVFDFTTRRDRAAPR